MQSTAWVVWAALYDLAFAVALIASGYIPLLQHASSLRFWVIVILLAVFLFYQPGSPHIPFGWFLAGLVSGVTAWLTFKLWRWAEGIVSRWRTRGHAH